MVIILSCTSDHFIPKIMERHLLETLPISFLSIGMSSSAPIMLEAAGKLFSIKTRASASLRT